MRVMVGGPAGGMIKFMNRATRKRVAVAEYYHARKHQPTVGIDGLEREGGDWGQLLQLRADWAGEEVRRQMRVEVDDQWAFVVDFAQLTGVAHAQAVGNLYSRGERELGESADDLVSKPSEPWGPTALDGSMFKLVHECSTTHAVATC